MGVTTPPQSEGGAAGSGRLARAATLAAILGLTFIAYLPVLFAGFTNWDDPAFVTRNPLVHELSWSSVAAIFSHFHWAAYAPLTLLSFALEHALVGLEPWLYHLDNLLLHLVVTALVLAWVRRLDPRRGVAVVAALLFGLHTIHVESVAWIAERRDVLYGAFFVAALLSYHRFLDTRRARSYAGALALFLLALLAKAVAVTLPVVLLAVDALTGRRLASRRLVLEKLPFVALALVFGLVAVRAERAAGGVANAAGTLLYTLLERAALACWSVGAYLVKLLAPVSLSAFYPYPEPVNGALAARYWLGPLVVVTLAALFVAALRRRPSLAFSIALFGVCLAPVLQLLPYANFVIADRYLYIPSIGYCLAASVVAVTLAERGRRWRLTVVATVAVYALGLGALTFARCHVWHDSLALWNDVLAKHPRVWTAWDNRGSARAELGDYAGAIADHSRAIELEPGFAGAYYNRGNAKARSHDLEGAAKDYAAALLLKPDDLAARRNLELVRRTLATRGEAGLGPPPAATPAPAHGADDLATAAALFDAGRQREAVAMLDRLVDRGDAGAKSFLARGVARFNLGDLDGARADLDRVVELAPGLAAGHAYRAAVRIALGDSAGAEADCDRALEREPALVDALVTRAAARYNLGRPADALPDLDRALALEPDNPKALLNRGVVRLRLGEREAACRDLARAAALGSAEAATVSAQSCW